MANQTSAPIHARIPSLFADDYASLESTCIYWGVFWDIENVQVGIYKTNFMIEKVKEFVKSKQDGRYVHKDPLFVCAADFKNQKDSLVKVLQEAKVELHHVLKGKDSADDDIIVSFQKFNLWPVKTAVVIITSDRKLMKTIENSVRDFKFECNVFLIYKQESDELKKYVAEDKGISFDELMQHTGKRYFQKFFELIASHWKHISHVNKQTIIVKLQTDGEKFSFKNIKWGEVIFYLNSDQKKNIKMNFTVSKSTTAQEMKNSLTFVTIILVYNNHLLKNLQQDNPKNKEIIDKIKTMLKSLNIFLACMPWHVQYCEDKINDCVEDLTVAITVKDQCSTILTIPALTDIEIMCTILGLRDDIVNINGGIKYEEDACQLIIKALEQKHQNDTANEQHINKDTFYKIGFTEEKATFLVESIPEDLLQHRSALVWAKSHVKHLFQNHPLLSTSGDFPHFSNTMLNSFLF